MQTVVEDGRRTDGYIRTFTGRKVFIANPSPDSIIIEDMAHSLSQMCRFTGHCKVFYSVAQHSVYVSWICAPEHALWGLLHEGGEQHFSDVSTIGKRLPGMEAYRAYEANSRTITAVKFGLQANEPPEVKTADNLLLVTEQRDLMWGGERSSQLQPLNHRIKPWSCRKAERVFLLRFAELTGAPLRWYESWYLHWIRKGWTPQITT